MSIADKLNTIAENEQKVYEAGKQTEYDRFWDTFQRNGARTNYWGAFAYWKDEIFAPTYPFNNIDENNYMFMGAGIPVIPRLVFANNSGPTQTFYNNYTVHTIECIKLKEDGTQKFHTTFQNCTNLKNITIEGKIGQNGFDVRWSTKLTHESLMSIINALYDYSADTSGTTWTLTIGSDNIAKLTEEELEMIRAKGWTYA